MKKIVSAALAVAALVTLIGCQKKGPAEAGKVLNIHTWNEEFQDRFNTYYASKLPEDVKVNWIITPFQDGAYQNKLDEALLRQNDVPADEKVDIFLVEAEYALKYVDTDFTLDVIKDVGITRDQIKDQYKYTQDIMTDSKGNLKGLTWQACPGGFIYRRSIAKDVLGTDDPDEIGKALADWDKFDDVAAKAKAKGYFMLSGFTDDFRVFSDNMTQPWVVNNKITIDPQIHKWVAQTKTYTEKGYNNRAQLFSAESTQGMGAKGKVFGYFGPAWFIDFIMAPSCLDDQNKPREVGNGSFGDWAFCKGPQGFSWGGTWICAARGTDNIEIIKDLLETLTCNAEVMTEIAVKSGDFTNNVPAMETIAKSDYKNPFLGGQNHIRFFLESAKSIDKTCISPYDLGMTEKIQAAMTDYFNDKVTLEKAWDNFFTAATELFPNLTR
ncbi:MAG: carbohydrate ABC transporter substrate-binding protein [Treponema sp.]|nr:carbohydrate ABC transporter substrate-binding protein [Treponema sp.]